MHPQMPLALESASRARFERFHIDEGNRLARDGARALVEGDLDSRQVFLWGEAGAGKSHLLSAACHLGNAQGYRVALVTAALANNGNVFEGLERADLVCIDDVQVLDAPAETALFHFINRCHESGARLMFAARQAPRQLSIQLPDLVTRLSWGPVFHVAPLGESGLAAALREEFAQRALTPGDEVFAWMLKRLPRDMQTLEPLIERIDQLSLQTQRRVTIPLVREALETEDTAGQVESLLPGA